MHCDDDFDFEYDLADDDEFEDVKSFDEFLKEIGKTEKQVRQEYSEFMLWFEAMRQRLDIKTMQKAVFCRKVCAALKNEYSKDFARLWCLCFSEYSDFIFEKQEDFSDRDYMEYRIGRCALLSADIGGFMQRLEAEVKNREKFMRLRENISYSEETFLQIDLDDFHMIVTDGVGLSGEFLKDNLTYVCEKISHSKELSEIAPDVFYALLMRYRKKLSDTEGFMPNFKSATRFVKYEIEKDNGKNQNIYMEHIAVYQALCEYFWKCGRDLCDVGFACMSNLCENGSFDWHEFPKLVRPLAAELRDRYFSCFPNGLADNPVFAANDIHTSDMIAFEDFYEAAAAPKARIICYVREYLAKHSEPAEEYISLLEKGETDKCMKIIHDIIERSEINPEFIKPEMSDVVNAVIMEEILENISERVRGELLGVLTILKDKICFRREDVV
ncbi:MAG: hypothetical protein NC452_08535 [Eubacterium sp.]|nr:hypothetical protein [Eubacterium sp.]